MYSTRAFAKLFHKYRLQSEFETLTQLGDALAEKGFIYEDSIFSRWQKGSRVPKDRNVLLALIAIFVEKSVLSSLEEANAFLASANQGVLSELEVAKLGLDTTSYVFQAPQEIANFIGRESTIRKITKDMDIEGKVLLLHGPAGIGKTALAIALAHRLKTKYTQGVLWYKVEHNNTRDILLSIVHALGEDIPHIQDISVLAALVRALLTSRNMLLVLDSAELSEDILLAIPKSTRGTVLITSQRSTLTDIEHVSVAIPVFTEDESFTLYNKILGNKKVHKHKNALLAIAKQMGYLPLAVHIFARRLAKSDLSEKKLSEVLEQEVKYFDNLRYEGKSLEDAITSSYQRLSRQMQAVLVSASIFKGNDFSFESIRYINGISGSTAIHTLQQLVNLSLVEQAGRERYRLHPAIQQFVRGKLDTPKGKYLIPVAWGMYACFALWWVYLQLFIDPSDAQYGWFAGTYGLLALYGGINGVFVARNWGGSKTVLGKSIYAFSIGLLLQLLGQAVYSYYSNILDVSVPYPSLGDLGYFGSIPAYIYGAIQLARSSGISLAFRSFQEKILTLLIPISVLTFGYSLFLSQYEFDSSTYIKTFLDFAYPLGEAVYISIAILLFIFSRSVLDGILKSRALFLLVALVFQFIADYMFLYTAESYYQGNFVEMFYLTAYLTMTLALLHLRTIRVSVKE